MIPFVEDCYFYSRENNFIIANLTHGDKIPLVRLYQKFIDVIVLEGEPRKYMERYMAMHPHLWETIESKPISEQLKLF